MDIGAESPILSARVESHSASLHSYERSHTIEPVLGGVSARNANGSALSTRKPAWRERMWNLYTSPVRAPSTRPDQMPDEWTGSRRSDPVSQPLKSPTTETCSAFGAHTAKEVPSGCGCAPSFSARRPWVPSAKR